MMSWASSAPATTSKAARQDVNLISAPQYRLAPCDVKRNRLMYNLGCRNGNELLG
jgi:hypothetical protein